MEAVPMLNGLWLLLFVVGLSALYRMIFVIEQSHPWVWMLSASFTIGVTSSKPALGLVCWTLLLIATFLYPRDTLRGTAKPTTEEWIIMTEPNLSDGPLDDGMPRLLSETDLFDPAKDTCDEHCVWTEEQVGAEEQARIVLVCHEHGTEVAAHR